MTWWGSPEPPRRLPRFSLGHHRDRRPRLRRPRRSHAPRLSAAPGTRHRPPHIARAARPRARRWGLERRRGHQRAALGVDQLLGAPHSGASPRRRSCRARRRARPRRCTAGTPRPRRPRSARCRSSDSAAPARRWTPGRPPRRRSRSGDRDYADRRARPDCRAPRHRRTAEHRDSRRPRAPSTTTSFVVSAISSARPSPSRSAAASSTSGAPRSIDASRCGFHVTATGTGGRSGGTRAAIAASMAASARSDPRERRRLARRLPGVRGRARQRDHRCQRAPRHG